MQLLYILESADDTQLFKNPVNELQKQLDKSKELLVYLLFFITETARYAETDARMRASKNLVTEDDLNVNTKIAGNECLWQLLEMPSFKQLVEDYKFSAKIDKELVRKIYQTMVESEDYKVYVNEQGRDKKKEKDIIRFIFSTLLLPNESFEAHISEIFSNWDDDAEMMEQLIQGVISKPAAYNLSQRLSKEKWDFAKKLLETVLDKKEYALELIKPKLKNWDAERIALLDMIIMQMGVCEILYFETIPVKVSINEYIDLAKDYSTPQSGQFVNGILDNINKELSAAGKIEKIDFKQKTR